MDRIRALIADQHRVFAESLATALSAEQDVEASAAGGAHSTVRLLRSAEHGGSPFHVLLADIDCEAEIAAAVDAPCDSAAGAGEAVPAEPLSLAEVLRRRFPEVRLVVLASRDDAAAAARLLGSGASGWVAKDSSLARLLHVLRGVLRGETHLPPALLTGVLRELTRERQGRSDYQRLADALTPRELEVLRCMLAGLGRKAVAERLYLSPHTVRTHMQNVLGKLGVHSTLAAVALARQAGVPPAD